MKIYLVRHARPEGITGRKRYIGKTDLPLSAEGRDRADEAGSRIARLENGHAVTIVSSPLARCLDTALIIREHVNCCSFRTDQDLREIDMGVWDGMYLDEVKAKHPDEYEARGHDLWNYRTPGGETFAETGARFKAALDRIIQSAADDDAVIAVTHGGAVRAGLSLMTDKSFDEWMKTAIPYTCTMVLKIDEGRITDLSSVN